MTDDEIEKLIDRKIAEHKKVMAGKIDAWFEDMAKAADEHSARQMKGYAVVQEQILDVIRCLGGEPATEAKPRLQ
jgi:hypothetical protein